MKKPLNIFLDSSCTKSKALYPKNNGMEFTFDLPERMDFKRNWHVALKSLLIPTKFINVDDCYVKYFYYNWALFDDFQRNIVTITSSHHSSIESVLQQFNRVLEIFEIQIRAKIVGGKVRMGFYDGWREWPYSNSLTLSPKLAHILGFQKYDGSKKNGEFEVEFNKRSTQVASYEPDIFLLYPRNLIIGCDIVGDTMFSGERIKLLRLVTNPIDTSSDMISYDFLQNEYVELKVKEFKSISIRIADISGETIKCDFSSCL